MFIVSGWLNYNISKLGYWHADKVGKMKAIGFLENCALVKKKNTLSLRNNNNYYYCSVVEFFSSHNSRIT